MKLLAKLAIGILSVPIAAGVTISFYRNLVLVKSLAGSISFFMWGAFAYMAFHLLLHRPVYLYVLGHESVHAAIAWILGGKIKSFKISEKGGSVGTTNSNFVIELGPYFIPIYAIIISLVYIVVASSYRINGSVFIFLIGFAMAFHMILTVEVMKARQPDIVKSGYLFSVVMIYVLNIVVISLMFSMIFSQFSAKKFFVDSYVISRDAYGTVVRQLFF